MTVSTHVLDTERPPPAFAWATSPRSATLVAKDLDSARPIAAAKESLA